MRIAYRYDDQDGHDARRRSASAVAVGLNGAIRCARTFRNLSAARLCEEAVRRGEGVLAASGALVCTTGAHTGRSPQDKYIVRDSSTAEQVWWGTVNRPLDPAYFEVLEADVANYFSGREAFVQECCAGADPEYRLPVRVVTDRAWHSLFARNLLIPRAADAPVDAQVTIVDASGFRCDPARHGTRSDVCVALHLARRLVIITGTGYAGEIKKSVFTLLNFLLPGQDVLPMHCSANVGRAGDVALFFGLSGTGKTTLSSDACRQLIGDDEHGWSERGVFNFEGGCYAKLIRLSREAEPQIFGATERFGAVLENVIVDDETRVPDFDDASITENTRGAYPLAFIDNHVPEARAGHPAAIVMLTADAFGVLPPIARLSPAQAMYHFLSGYTARVAGTERGVKDPSAVFSTCFAAPFLPLRPSVYARSLGQKIARHQSATWLVNTGWIGGPAGAGHRISIAHTRAIVAAALSGGLQRVAMRTDPVFGLEVPVSCPGVPDTALDPRRTWPDGTAYDAMARRLAAMFRDNFQGFAPDVSAEVGAAGPSA
jgi:phosphoenolpyruvate carboxykinase (ATP)